MEYTYIIHVKFTLMIATFQSCQVLSTAETRLQRNFIYSSLMRRLPRAVLFYIDYKKNLQTLWSKASLQSKFCKFSMTKRLALLSNILSLFLLKQMFKQIGEVICRWPKSVNLFTATEISLKGKNNNLKKSLNWRITIPVLESGILILNFDSYRYYSSTNKLPF